MFGTAHPLPMRWLLAGALGLVLASPALAQRGPADPPAGGPQARQLMRPPLPSRDISDQDHARSRMRSGQNRSFEDLLGSARRVGRGEFLAVEPDISTNIYRFKFMRPTGNMVWVDVDGRTGRVIAERE